MAVSKPETGRAYLIKTTEVSTETSINITATLKLPASYFSDPSLVSTATFEMDLIEGKIKLESFPKLVEKICDFLSILQASHFEGKSRESFVEFIMKHFIPLIPAEIFGSDVDDAAAAKKVLANDLITVAEKQGAGFDLDNIKLTTSSKSTRVLSITLQRSHFHDDIYRALVGYSTRTEANPKPGFVNCSRFGGSGQYVELNTDIDFPTTDPVKNFVGIVKALRAAMPLLPQEEILALLQKKTGLTLTPQAASSEAVSGGAGGAVVTATIADVSSASFNPTLYSLRVSPPAAATTPFAVETAAGGPVVGAGAAAGASTTDSHMPGVI